MPLDLPSAIEEIQKQFLKFWRANSASILGYIPAIEWHGVESESKQDRSKVWLRFSTQNVFEEQATLSTNVEIPFSRRFDISGLVFVQFFIPKSLENGLIQGRKLAEIAKNAFRGKRFKSVSLLNSRVNEIPPEELYYRLNVICEYDFSEIYNVENYQEQENLNTIIFDRLAAQSLGGHRVVRSIGNNLVDYASHDQLAHIDDILGISLNAAVLNGDIRVIRNGVLANSGWNWTPLEPVYLGLNGLLTQVVPSFGFVIEMGYAESPTSIIVDIGEPIEL